MNESLRVWLGPRWVSLETFRHIIKKHGGIYSLHELQEEEVEKLLKRNTPWEPPGYTASKPQDLLTYVILVDAFTRADQAERVKRDRGRDLLDLLEDPRAREVMIYTGISSYLANHWQADSPHHQTFEYDLPYHLSEIAVLAMTELAEFFDTVYLITPDIGWIAGRTELMAKLAPMLHGVVRHHLSTDSKPYKEYRRERYEFPSEVEEMWRQSREHFARAERSSPA